MGELVGETQAEVGIALRVSTETLSLIDQAAAAQGKSRSEFILESVGPRAIESILDQRVFKLNKKQTARFLDVLINPPKANEALKALMRKRPILD